MAVNLCRLRHRAIRGGLSAGEKKPRISRRDPAHDAAYCATHEAVARCNGRAARCSRFRHDL
ncbi:MAG: hypothetical protein M5U07_20225 [Xanthobacteraceae bacterium]|nr:hypothetical protein [Xanthobacteraceae bacterium]